MKMCEQRIEWKIERMKKWTSENKINRDKKNKKRMNEWKCMNTEENERLKKWKNERLKIRLVETRKKSEWKWVIREENERIKKWKKWTSEKINRGEKNKKKINENK